MLSYFLYWPGNVFKKIEIDLEEPIRVNCTNRS